MGICFWGTQEEAFRKAMQQIAETPAEFEPPMSYENVEISTEQAAIHRFWLPARSTAPVAIYLHGQDAIIGKNLYHGQCLSKLGCSVLVIDDRGCEATFGAMTLAKTSVSHDAEIAWTCLTKTRGIAPEQILICGRSLGGGIAIELASSHPEAGGLIV